MGVNCYSGKTKRDEVDLGYITNTRAHLINIINSQLLDGYNLKMNMVKAGKAIAFLPVASAKVGYMIAKDTKNAISKFANEFLKGTLIYSIYKNFIEAFLLAIFDYTKSVYVGQNKCFVKKAENFNNRNLTKLGKAPIVLNVGVHATNNKSQDLAKLNSDVKTMLKANAHKGIVVLNSADDTESCRDLFYKLGNGKFCVSSHNGAFVAVNDDGKLTVLRDTPLAKDSINALCDFFAKTENSKLLQNFDVVLQNKSKLGCTIDFANKKVHSSLGTTKVDDLDRIFAETYSIKFVPKLTRAQNKAFDKSTLYQDLMGKCTEILYKMDDDTKALLNETASIQFGTNGSVYIVPNGCSKSQSAKLIADYYGVDKSQILNMANTLADVSEPFSFAELTKYYDMCGLSCEAVNKLGKINPDLLLKPDNLVLPANYFGSDDMALLNQKVKDTSVQLGKALTDAQIQKEAVLLMQQDEELNDKKQQADEWIQQINELSEYTDQDSIDKVAELHTRLDEFKQEYKQNFDAKLNDAKGKVKPIEINTNQFNTVSLGDLALKICQLSTKNFTAKPKTF